MWASKILYLERAIHKYSEYTVDPQSSYKGALEQVFSRIMTIAAATKTQEAVTFWKAAKLWTNLKPWSLAEPILRYKLSKFCAGPMVYSAHII